MSSLLVVAGEPSGDRAAAGVVRRLAHLDVFGTGGPALRRAGSEELVPLADSAAMGGAAIRQAAELAKAYALLLLETKRRQPKSALLVGFSDFNARLAPRLKRRGMRVVWYIAPQIWAWRAKRAKRIAESIDVMALTLPFEERLWQEAGARAVYVGHPSLEIEPQPRSVVRRQLGMTERASAVAILPGSRRAEAHALTDRFIDAYELVRRDRASVDARIFIAPGLPADVARWIEARAQSARIGVVRPKPEDGAAPLLSAFDVSLVASGTATLEAAIADAVPVAAYRVGLATELAARFAADTSLVALPNILLGRRVFSELLQREAEPVRLADALERALERRGELVDACRTVRAILGGRATPSQRVAELLESNGTA